MKKKVKQFKIYSLRAKDSDLVEYVGVTSTYLSSRLSQHVYNSKNKKTISAKLISTLKDRPIIELIENVTEQTWEEKEIYWIAYYKAINPKLKNQKKGGNHVYLAEDRSTDSIERSRLAHCIKIYGWLIDGTYIGEFISTRDAERELNLTKTSVSKCLKGNNSRAGKYWFSYENNFIIKPKSLDSLIPKPKKLTTPASEYYIIDNINNVKIIHLQYIAKYLNLPFGSLRHYVKNKILHPELLLHQKEYKNKFHLFLLNNPHIKFMVKDIV